MSASLPIDVKRLIKTLLHDGTLLYPYRPSLKNSRACPLASLVPPTSDESSSFMAAECLLKAPDETSLRAEAHFLHHCGSHYVERVVTCESEPLSTLRGQAARTTFCMPSAHAEQRVAGALCLSVSHIDVSLHRVRVELRNETIAEPEHTGGVGCEAFERRLISPQIVLCASDGAFLSCTAPPKQCASIECRNVGCWPVLVGQAHDGRTVLASPTILEDYPRLAPESHGDFFDATEIDEMLALRIMTLADHEKVEMAADDRGRALLQRTMNLDGEALLNLHGAVREVRSGASDFSPGDRVRLKPRARADAFDLILAGMTATVLSVERDFENRTYLALTIDDDPGAAEGRERRIGHRFFYFPDEVELVQSP